MRVSERSAVIRYRLYRERRFGKANHFPSMAMLSYLSSDLLGCLI